MKRYGALIALVLALGFGTLAVVLANRWLSSRNPAVKTAAGDTLPATAVVVAAKDLPVGTKLSAQALAVTDWPRASVPKGAFSDPKQGESRVNVNRLAAGEPILSTELAPAGSAAGMVALIGQGKRAMAIRVDEVTGVGGFVLPETHVDVINVENLKNDQKKVRIILQDVRVLAIAQETYVENGKAKVVKTVTLEVTPRQAETLALGTHEGSINLVLRNPMEKEPAPQAVVARRVIHHVYRPRPKPFDVEVIRRSKRESISFKTADSDDRI